MWWRRRPVEDFRQEIEAHLELEALALEREHGLSPSDARRLAQRRFGSLAAAQDRFRDSRRIRWSERLAQHVVHAIRSLRRQPGFSLGVVATLAIGIGVLTGFFTFLHGFLRRPLPLADSDRLVRIEQDWLAGGPHNADGGGWFAWQDYFAYRSRARAEALESISVYAPTTVVVGGLGEEIRGELVSCDWFATLRVRFIAGRGFRDDECAHPGAGDVVVLGHRVWSRYFDADSGVVGRTVLINNRPLTIVGVSEERFAGVQVQRTELWIPATQRTALRHGTDSMLVHPLATWLAMVGRLAPGATPQEASAELQLARRALDEASPGRETRVRVREARFAYLDDADGRLLVIAMSLLGALVLVMGCANVMNLLLARALTRRREIGIRLAIGASRARLIEQLLIESAVLALLAGFAGFALAHFVPRIVYAVSPLAGMQVDLAPDASVLGFALAIALATTLLFGLVPALQATALELSAAIRGAFSVGGRSIRPSRLRSAMVVCQVSGSTLLLIVAGLFARAATSVAAVDPGLDPRNLYALAPDLWRLGYTEERARLVHEQLADRLRATPGVVEVANVEWLPLSGGSGVRVANEARPDERVFVMTNAVSASALATLRIPILRGRAFTAEEARLAEPRPAVISAAMARRLWPDTDALGTSFRVRGQWHVVVGIAGDLMAPTLDVSRIPTVYLPVESLLRARLLVRTAGPGGAITAAASDWARALDPAIVLRVEGMEARLDRALLAPRMFTAVAGGMGVLALLLALVGIYGVVSFAVTQRRREVAVRMALGATRAGVVGLMMRQGSGAAALGIALGVLLAAGASVALRALLFGMQPLDPAAYLAMIGAMAAAAMVAMYLPSRRAARVDPARELRAE